MRPLFPRDSSGSAKVLHASVQARLPRILLRIGAATASGYARGFRLSSELVAGVIVGAGLGWLIDRWFGVSPWGLIVFLLLGFAAGVLNVMRSAGVVASPGFDDRLRKDRKN